MAALILFYFTSVNGYAEEKTTLTIGAGVSNTSGSTNNYWKLGFAVGGNLFFKISPTVLVGARLAYNRWEPDETKLIKEFGAPGVDFEINGTAKVIEVVPSVRIMARTPERSRIKLFAQLGAGLYFINMKGILTTDWLIVLPADGIRLKKTRFGFNLGGGIILTERSGFRLECLPQYHIILTKGDPTRYFSFTLGAVFTL